MPVLTLTPEPPWVLLPVNTLRQHDPILAVQRHPVQPAYLSFLGLPVPGCSEYAAPAWSIRHAAKFASEAEARWFMGLIVRPGTDIYAASFKTKRYRVIPWRCVGKDWPARKVCVERQTMMF